MRAELSHFSKPAILHRAVISRRNEFLTARPVNTDVWLNITAANMAPDNAQAEFTNRLRAHGFELSTVSIDAGFSEAFAFYRDVRPVGCDEDLDGDMLLFQWGTYDLGEGRYFDLNLTRQFILDGTEDDEGIFQLGFTFLYTPSPALEALRDGNRWCRGPAELPEFQRYITSSEAYRVAHGQVPSKVQLTYESAG